MSDRRALHSALKWLYEKDGEPAPESRPRRKQRSRRDRPPNPGEKTRKGVPLSAFRHDRKCCICRHPQRDEIEREFLHWHGAERIAKTFGIAHHSSIYRHAHATGLFAQRATYLRISLSPIIEQAMVVPVAADSVVRAVIACAHLNDHGEWVNPPKHIIHHSSKRPQSAPPESEPQAKVNRETVSTST